MYFFNTFDNVRKKIDLLNFNLKLYKIKLR